MIKYLLLVLNVKILLLFLCFNGIIRMALEFQQFPEQYKVNINLLKTINNENITGSNILKKIYD